MPLRQRPSEAADDPERYGDAFIKRFSGTIIPTGVAQIARTIDPTVRETDGIAPYIQSRIPGLSDSLPAKLDVWGRPIVKEGGIGPDIVSPIWTSTAKGDPATWEAIRLNAPINLPSDDKDLSPEQMHRWRLRSGETAHKWVTRQLQADEYREADDDGRRRIIKKTMELARDYSKASVVSGAPIPNDEPDKRRPRKRGRNAPASRPITLDDIGDFDIISVPD